MVCPYCGRTMSDNSQFCPKCGQSITDSRSSSSANSYWGTVNKEDVERNRKYKDIEKQGVKNIRDRRNKTMVVVVVLLVAFLAVIIGGMKFSNNQKKMIDEVQSQLPGQTFTIHDSHMEGFGWIIHEYKQLTFKDENNLEYAYIKTTGPREDNEKPQYKGTYEFTISRSVTGSYTIHVNGDTYKLEVNDANEPTGISQ